VPEISAQEEENNNQSFYGMVVKKKHQTLSLQPPELVVQDS
jgi:hypothetical protein